MPVTLHISLRRQHEHRESLAAAGQLLLGAFDYKPADLFASNRYYIFIFSIFIHILSFSSICCTWENGVFILESKLLSAWGFQRLEVLRAGQDPRFQSVLCFQSRIMHSTILFYESLPLSSFLFSSCTLLADIQSVQQLCRRCLVPCRVGRCPCSSLGFLFLIVLREIRDKTSLRLDYSHQVRASVLKQAV